METINTILLSLIIGMGVLALGVNLYREIRDYFRNRETSRELAVLHKKFMEEERQREPEYRRLRQKQELESIKERIANDLRSRKVDADES